MLQRLTGIDRIRDEAGDDARPYQRSVDFRVYVVRS